MSKISVIIPTYNRADTLPRAINSILNQTYQDFEIIVVDDGSTDNTKSVIEEFQKKDNRIKYFYQENSGGPAKPMNIGIQKATGEFITFLASDDELAPKCLEKLISPFKSSKNIDVTSCNILIIDDKRNRIIGEVSFPKNTDNIHISNTLHSYAYGNIFIKHELFNKIGFFDEKIKVGEDADMWLRLAKNKLRLEFIYEPLYLCHCHQKQTAVTTDLSEKIRCRQYLIKKHREFYETYPKSYASILRDIGNMYICIGNMKKGRKYFIRGIKKNPLDFRHYVYLILSFLGRRLFLCIPELKKRFLILVFSIKIYKHRTIFKMP